MRSRNVKSIDNLIQEQEQEQRQARKMLQISEKLSANLGIQIAGYQENKELIETKETSIESMQEQSQNSKVTIDYAKRAIIAEQEKLKKLEIQEEINRVERQIKIGIIDIMSIIQKVPDKRTPENCLHLSIYLQQRVDYFMNNDFLDKEFMISLAEKMQCEVFKPGDILMRKGDIGDKMYVIIQGHLGVYMKKNPIIAVDSPVAILGEFHVVGERALKNDNDIRSASVTCLEDSQPCVCLSLGKEDYQKLLGVSSFKVSEP